MARKRWNRTLGSFVAIAGALAAAAVASASGATSGLSAATVIADQAATSKVIVVLGDQYSADPATSQFDSRRGQLEATDQAALLAQVKQAGGRQIRPYRTLNAFSATVTASEEASLSANPSV